MLLRFRPDIKPPMWGPLDAVRFAVRANCERIGINCAAIDGYWPLFERGGSVALDVIQGASLSLAGGADWAPLGVRVYSSSGSTITGFNANVNAAATERTCLAWLANISAFSGNDARIFANRDSWSDPQGFALETTSSKLRFRHDTPSGRVDILSTVDTRQGVGPVNYRQNDPMLFGVAYGPGTCEFFLDAKNVPADTVAHASSGIIASVRNFSIGNAIAFLNNLTVMGALVLREKLSKEIVERLGYEPYTLLMPVARPVYFDLGATTGTDALTASNLTISAPVLGTPALGQTHTLVASGITVEGPVLGAPALAQIHALTAQNFTASSPVLGAPAVGQVHALTANNLTVSSPVLGTPALIENAADVDALTAVDLVVGSPVLGTPALGQIHVLGSDGLITGAPVLGSPTLEINAEHLVAADLIIGSPVLGAPAVGQVHLLSAVNLSVSAPVLGTPSLEIGKDHLVAVDLVVEGPVLGTPALKQIHTLVAEFSTPAPMLDAPALRQIHTLTAEGLSISSPVLGTPMLFDLEYVLQTRAELGTMGLDSVSIGCIGTTDFTASYFGVTHIELRCYGNYEVNEFGE